MQSDSFEVVSCW